MNKPNNAIRGSIIQITNPDHKWFPCLLIVDEVRGFGVLAYITIPTNDEKENGNAFIRVNTDDFECVGNSAVVIGGNDD